MRFYLMGNGLTGVKMNNFTIGKDVENLHVSAQNTQTPKNTENIIKIAKNTQLTSTPNNNNTKKHTTTTHPIAKSKTNYSIATSNNTQNTSYNNNNTNKESFIRKPSKNPIISNTPPIANINNLNSKNSKITKNNQIIPMIVIENSKKLQTTSISIANIKTTINSSIARIQIDKSIKTIVKLNKSSVISDYFDNSLVDK